MGKRIGRTNVDCQASVDKTVSDTAIEIASCSRSHMRQKWKHSAGEMTVCDGLVCASAQKSILCMFSGGERSRKAGRELEQKCVAYQPVGKVVAR